MAGAGWQDGALNAPVGWSLRRRTVGQLHAKFIWFNGVNVWIVRVNVGVYSAPPHLFGFNGCKQALQAGPVHFLHLPWKPWQLGAAHGIVRPCSGKIPAIDLIVPGAAWHVHAAPPHTYQCLVFSRKNHPRPSHRRRLLRR